MMSKIFRIFSSYHQRAIITSPCRYASSKPLRELVRAPSSQCENEPPKPKSIPFWKAKLGNFTQSAPTLRNQFQEDALLQNYLRRMLPTEMRKEIFQDLENFGDRVANDIYTLHLECERDPPRLQQFDAWGNRIDEIITCDAWKKMHAISAQEGLVAIPYERKFHEWSRLYQVAKLYLYVPSSGLYGCPLAMTDGAAKTIEILGVPPELNNAYTRLTSRDPSLFWTSGQWMTEKRGGSDVARGTETVAVPQDDGSYRLYGYKWFSSATDSDMTITLARIMDEKGNIVEGTKGLSTFYLETRDSEGRLNNIQVQRLKNKLGTRQLPTAELLLDGVRAHRISEAGHGVARISTMLTVTRIHTALNAVASMRRMLSLARDYSTKRDAFGNTISSYPLHMQTLSRMEVETRGGFLLLMETARLLGLDDCNMATEHDKNMLRILTPISKLYSGKQGMKVMSEGLESFGGQGYIEDTGLPSMLRDAQVLPIWEGTTNILSLDVLRCIAKSQGSVLQSFQDDVFKRLQVVDSPSLVPMRSKVQHSCDQLMDFVSKNLDNLEVAARYFAFSLARVYTGTLLLEHASGTGATKLDEAAAERWCQNDLTPMITCAEDYNKDNIDIDKELVMDGYLGNTDTS